MKKQESSPIRPGRALLLALIAAVALIVAAAPSASASEDLVLVVPQAVPLTASVSLECGAANPIRVQVGNSSGNVMNIVVSINGEDVSGLEPVGANQAFLGNYFATENAPARVVVTSGATELADTLFQVNCVPTEGSFEFIPNCNVGQAWVELTNVGPDTGTFGVRYPNLPHAGAPIAVGDTVVQPLAVQPNEFVDFSIEVDGESIYSDGYFFDCTPPEPEPEPDDHPPVQPDQPAPSEEPAAAVPEPQPEADIEPQPEAAIELDSTETIVGPDDTDELATGPVLQVGEQSSARGAILVGGLLTLGLALTFGSVAALRARR